MILFCYFLKNFWISLCIPVRTKGALFPILLLVSLKNCLNRAVLDLAPGLKFVFEILLTKQ
jgi:hypothetical protein